MRNVNVVYLKDVDASKVSDFNRVAEVIHDELTGYYKIENRSKDDINNGIYKNQNNLCCVIAPDDTVLETIYKDKMETFERITCYTILYKKIEKQQDNVIVKKSKRKKSFGIYILKTEDGKYMIVDSHLANNPLLNESIFEYEDIETGKIYTDEIFRNSIGYNLENLLNYEVLNSDFFKENKSFIHELLVNDYKRECERKKNKTNTLKKIFKGK